MHGGQKPPVGAPKAGPGSMARPGNTPAGRPQTSPGAAQKKSWR
jgi:hypothetical protein